MIYLEVKKEGKIIFSNLKIPCNNNYKEFSFKEKNNNLTVRIFTDDNDLIISKKIFKKTIGLLIQIINSVEKDYQNKIELNNHTIRTIQAKMSQKMDSFLTKENFISDNYNNLINKIEDQIKSDFKKTSDLICQLNNRINEIDLHLESLSLLFSSQTFETRNAGLKKVLLKIHTPFLGGFQKKNINLFFNIKDDYKLRINYKIFNLVMHHFFHNSEKYTKDDTKIVLEIKEEHKKYLIITMISLNIKNKQNIFEEGFSGKNTEDLAGSGIGMYVIKKGLIKLGMDITVKDEGEIIDNKYKKNIFVITLPD